jgi:mono/diheme cytochrome c family protein
MATSWLQTSIVGRGAVVGSALAAAAGLALTLAACVGAPPEGAVDDPALVEGRAVYGAGCASCHGADGGGGMGRKLSDGAVLDAFPDIEDQVTVILDGRGQMPAFAGRLSEDEVRAVVRYTREVL